MLEYRGIDHEQKGIEAEGRWRIRLRKFRETFYFGKIKNRAVAEVAETTLNSFSWASYALRRNWIGVSVALPRIHALRHFHFQQPLLSSGRL